MNKLEKKIDFNESEHKAGHHLTFTENCYECHKRDRLIKAYRAVNEKKETFGLMEAEDDGDAWYQRDGRDYRESKFNQGLDNWGERDFGKLN